MHANKDNFKKKINSIFIFVSFYFPLYFISFIFSHEIFQESNMTMRLHFFQKILEKEKKTKENNFFFLFDFIVETEKYKRKSNIIKFLKIFTYF